MNCKLLIAIAVKIYIVIPNEWNDNIFYPQIDFKL